MNDDLDEMKSRVKFLSTYVLFCYFIILNQQLNIGIVWSVFCVSICLPVDCVSVHLSTCLPACLSSVCLSSIVSLCKCFCLSASLCWSVGLSFACQPACYLSISVYLSACRLSLWLSVFLLPICSSSVCLASVISLFSCLTVSQFVNLFFCLPFCLSLSVCVSVSLSTYLIVSICICPFIHPSVYSVCPSIHVSL